MISIGKMSLASHVSIKTLRYYDRIGLLKPAAIDEESGYRYYTLDQIETMVLINRYKRFGFSLQEIDVLLHCDSKRRNQLLEGQKFELRRKISEMEIAMRDLEVVQERLDHQEEKKSMQDYQITIVEAKEQTIFGHRAVIGIGDFGEAYSILFEEMGKKGIRPAGPNGSRYYDSDFDENSSDVEVFVIVDNKEVANGTIGGSLMAHTVHKGGYSTLNEGYAALVKWIEENGYEVIGAPYELYTRNGYDRIPTSEWETEIFFPIAQK